MTTNILCRSFKLAFIPFLSTTPSEDKLENKTKTEQTADITVTNETGWDRIKSLFEIDEFGNVTNEVQSVLQTCYMSMLGGAIYGGTVYGKRAYETFIRNNEATSFTTHMEAKRKLQNAVSVGMGKGAFKFGWRLTLFCTTYVSLVTLIQAYRGKYGLLEYVVGGSGAGFLYKFNAGPRGWIAGAGLGTALGTFCGGLTLGLLKATGLSMEEAKYWQSKWKVDRDEYLRKGIQNYMEEEDFAVLKLHNLEVGESGASLDNLENSKRREIIME